MRSKEPPITLLILLSILAFVLLFIGISSVLISVSLDNKNLITTSYLRDQKLEARAEINSPILSNSPEPPAQPWLFLEYILAVVGSIFYIPFLLIHALQIILPLIIEYIINQISDSIKWIIGGIVAIIILCCSFVGIPLTQGSGNTTPTPTPSIPLSSIRPLGPNEGIYYATLHVTAPPHIKQGQSQILELKFDLTDQNIDGAIPIILPQANTYTVTVNTQLVNFDLSSPPPELQENRPVNINQPVKWQWVVTPKLEAEGNQSIIWTLELKDSHGITYQDFPIVKLEIQIKPKLGIPSWILAPNFTLGALISGILLNSVGYLIKKKKEKEEREANKIREEKEEWIKSNPKYYALLIVNPKYGVIVCQKENHLVIPHYTDKPSQGTSVRIYSVEDRIRDEIKDWIKQDLGIKVTNMRIIQKKTRNNYFYVVCNTSADEITGEKIGAKWTGNFRGIRGIEGDVDDEMFELIWKGIFPG